MKVDYGVSKVESEEERAERAKFFPFRLIFARGIATRSFRLNSIDI